MTAKLLFDQRRIRVCSWNATPGFISAASAAVEQQLRQLVQLDIIEVKSLDDPAISPCDLLLISADGFEEDQYPVWLKTISGRIPKAHGINVPTIIFGALSAPIQAEILRWAFEGNWYFDIVDFEHITSLPVRVANFLRIHDHLHEIRRMSEEMKSLDARVIEMESKLSSLLKGSDTK